VEEFLDDALEAYGERETEIEALDEGLMRNLERYIVLQVVDTRWREHLEAMDYMREGIGLRGLAQKDPLVEYRNEGHIMFTDLNASIRMEVIALLFHTQVEAAPAEEGPPALPAPGGNGGGPNGNLTYEHTSVAGAEAIAAAGAGAAAVGAAVAGDGSPVQQTIVKSEHENIGRNDPCWCGSGKKFKRCHGA
jgi:preprotein translocase subunit SecA